MQDTLGERGIDNEKVLLLYVLESEEGTHFERISMPLIAATLQNLFVFFNRAIK